MGQLVAQVMKLFLDALALGDVDAGSEQLVGAVVGIADLRAARKKPARAAVAVDHAVLDLDGLDLAADAGLHHRHDLFDVFRMIVAHPGRPRVRNFLVLEADEKLQMRVDVEAIGLRMPFPDTDGRGLGCHVMALCCRVELPDGMPEFAVDRSQIKHGDRDQQKDGLLHEDFGLAGVSGRPLRDAAHGGSGKAQQCPAGAGLAESHRCPEQQGKVRTEQQGKTGREGRSAEESEGCERNDAEREQGRFEEALGRRISPFSIEVGGGDDRRHDDGGGSRVRQETQ